MIRALVLAAALLASPALAVQPDEMLADPALEDRARELSKGLRCLVCRNESIDESNADLARDMRLLLRERIAGGDTDEEAVAFLVDRYGEYVLLQPTATGANLILWIAAPAMLVGGAAIAVTYLRRRAAARPLAAEGLSEAEKTRLADLLRD
jgi:cytochrome c-type biogenesis protein CcmH